MDFITFQYTPSTEDMAKTARYARTHFIWYWLTLIIFVGLLLCVIWFYLTYVTNWYGVVVAASPLIGLVTYHFWFERLLFKWKLRKHLQTFCQADDIGISWKVPLVESKFSWSYFDRLIRIEKLFLLRLASRPNCYVFVPRRAFDSPVQEDKFLHFAETGIAVMKSVREI